MEQAEKARVEAWGLQNEFDSEISIFDDRISNIDRIVSTSNATAGATTPQPTLTPDNISSLTDVLLANLQQSQSQLQSNPESLREVLNVGVTCFSSTLPNLPEATAVPATTATAVAVVEPIAMDTSAAVVGVAPVHSASPSRDLLTKPITADVRLLPARARSTSQRRNSVLEEPLNYDVSQALNPSCYFRYLLCGCQDSC